MSAHCRWPIKDHRMRDLYQVWPSALGDEQINRIVELAKAQRAEEATLFSSAEDLQGIRSCSVRWLAEPWIRALLWPYVQTASEQGFQVAVDGRCEMQMATYRSQHRDHYGWHHDVKWHGHAPVDRKISVTVQLTDPGSYEGGDIEFDEVSTNADFRSKGTVLLFPSYLRHRVRPVTSGTRRALVAWFSGPRWT